MLTVREAYRRLTSTNKGFTAVNAVDYDADYYIFVGKVDMYGVNKKNGDIVGFVPTTNLNKYFTAVKNRSISPDIFT